MMRPNTRRSISPVLLAGAISLIASTTHRAPAHPPTLPATPASGNPAEHILAVALLTTGEPALSPECFSTRFLHLANIEAGIDAAPELTRVALTDRAAMHRHPVAIMSGEGTFEFSAAHIAELRLYLERGGFLLASAGCSSHAWATSFERIIERLRADERWHDAPFEPIGPGHELFATVYKIRSLSTRRAASDGSLSDGPTGRLYALTLEGRICLIYSPDGLNDTDSAGAGCCCCGGSELREARWIMVNTLAYALLR